MIKIQEVVVLEEVSIDLNNGRNFYNEKQPGVGDYFWDSLIADIESLLIYGGVHKRENGLFRMLAKRFPYAIYYEIAENIAYVIAALPMKQDPKWLKNQLSSRT